MKHTRYLCYLLLLLELTAKATVLPPAAKPAITYNCELVIAEGSLGGAAAALQASRLGIKTCLTSMTDWVGGQLTTQGVSAIDEPYHFSKADSDFLNKYAKKTGATWTVPAGPYFSAETYSDMPHTDEVLRSMKPLISQIPNFTSCWVSTHCFAPTEGNHAIWALLEPFIKNGTLTLILQAVPKRIKMVNGKIQSLQVVQRTWTGAGKMPYGVPLSQEILDWYDTKNSGRYVKQTITLNGKIFIDGTETAELAVLSGANYELGSPKTASTAAKPECVMAFVDPVNLVEKKPTLAMLDYLSQFKNPNPSDPFDISQDGEFKFWSDYPSAAGVDSVFTYRQISPQSTTLNWGPGGNDYSAKNFIVPPSELSSQLGNWQGGLRASVLKEAESRAYAFSYWLSQLPEVTWDNRGVQVDFDQTSPTNFFGTGTGLSKFPYVRESRRILGYDGYQVSIDDISTETNDLGDFSLSDTQSTHFFDSVGIGSYPLDTRDCPTGSLPAMPQDGVKRYQIPLRALISQNIPNLMVANKTLGVSQQANASFRVHPTEWNAGFGAGTAAAIALKSNLDAHELMQSQEKIEEVQKQIVASGGRVLWFSELIPSQVTRPSPQPSVQAPTPKVEKDVL